jgi:hypothetical protein
MKTFACIVTIMALAVSMTTAAAVQSPTTIVTAMHGLIGASKQRDESATGVAECDALIAAEGTKIEFDTVYIDSVEELERFWCKYSGQVINAMRRAYDNAPLRCQGPIAGAISQMEYVQDNVSCPLQTGAIIGIVVGVLVALGMLFVLCKNNSTSAASTGAAQPAKPLQVATPVTPGHNL